VPVGLLRCRFLLVGFWCWRCLLGAWLPCGPASAEQCNLLLSVLHRRLAKPRMLLARVCCR
jgi:hypothetical protein